MLKNGGGDFTLVEYVWLDAVQGHRSKTKVVHGKRKAPITLKELSWWNFDGSSTNQAPGSDSEVIIRPVALFNDPFRGKPHVIALCDNYTPKGQAIPSNTRAIAAKVFSEKKEEVPWFGIEQEYVLFKDGAPLGWPTHSTARSGQPNDYAAVIGYPGPQGPYYCSNGADVAFGRAIVEEHMLACATAGVKISGTNAEVLPGQWEFQVGPCVGIEAGDHMTMARYLLARVCEKYGVVVSYDPKPIRGDWNGSGGHTNFSTKAMRENSKGLDKYIVPAIEKLGKRHAEHMKLYGEGNERRLTGHHETQSINKFSWGIANRGASVRVGNETAKNKRGYFEDRRPAANLDPYLVTALIYDTAVLNAKYRDTFPSHAVEQTRRASFWRKQHGSGRTDKRVAMKRSFEGDGSESTEGSEGAGTLIDPTKHPAAAVAKKHVKRSFFFRLFF